MTARQTRTKGTAVTVLLCCLAISAQAQDIRICRAVIVSSCVDIAATGFDGHRECVLADFIEAWTDRPAAVQTRAVVGYDKQNLYLHIECLEPSVDRLRAQCLEHDGPLFSDDCVAIQVAPRRGEAMFFQFSANARGTRHEKKIHDTRWDAPWTASASVGPDRWVLDVCIPFQALCARPERGSLWGLNVSRLRQAGGKRETSSWAPDLRGGVRVATRQLGYLIFDDDYAACLAHNILGPAESAVGELARQCRTPPVPTVNVDDRIAEMSRSLARLRPSVQAGQSKSAKQLGAALSEGEGILEKLANLKDFVGMSAQGVEVAAALRNCASREQPFVAYAVHPITNTKVLPIPSVTSVVSDRLSVTACRGEYEPASFVVFAFEDLEAIRVSATDLRSNEAALLASAVDLSVVKCWYQSGQGIGNEHQKILTPELLLKDDSLVRVDFENKENYLRLVFPSGETKWRWISKSRLAAEDLDRSPAAYPVQDARTLQPVTIPRNTAKQFWITIHVPGDAAPGVYEGQVDLSGRGGLRASLPLRLEVLPFLLEPNHLESSIYLHYGDKIVFAGPGSVHHSLRNGEQLRRELADLLAHGVDNPTVGMQFTKGTLEKVLQVRREVGMNPQVLYYLGTAHNPPPEERDEILRVGRQSGFREVYLYGQDEARGEALKAQRPLWEAVHAAGGKVFVAGYVGNNFPLVGDLQDLLVCAGPPSREEAALWHGKGHKIFCYANPQAGPEEPETFRRNFGLLLDRSHYDGGMTFAYYWEGDDADDWNDFCGTTYRGHNFVYPTVDGVIDTIQWEGYREGIDDLRYLATLRKAIARAEFSRSPALQREAAAATRFIEEMDLTDLYQVRQEMIRRIRQLDR